VEAHEQDTARGRAVDLARPWALVEAFRSRRVLVLGDLVVDEWIHGPTRGLSREAPVPTVEVSRHELCAGAAANVAANVAALGGTVTLLSVVGDDEPGEHLLGRLDADGVDVSAAVRVPGRLTSIKRRLVSEHRIVARFDEGARGPVPEEVDRLLAEGLLAATEQVDAVLVADYGLGALAGHAVREAVAETVRRGRLVLVDAHDVASWRLARPSVVTPDWEEALPLLGSSPAVRRALAQGDRVGAVTAGARALLTRTGAAVVVVTLDADGAVLLRQGRPALHHPTQPVEDAHSAGAGDAFAAALTLALASGARPDAAVALATAAGGVVVRREGTAVCSAWDLAAGTGPVVLDDVATAGRLAAAHREAGRRVVLTNGCFDVLHAGHVACLREAAALGDVLLVGLNTDTGARALKGAGRPVNPLADRAAVLAALGCVDHIVPFDGLTAVDLVRAVRPDVYVKGGDHDEASLAEAPAVRELGGRVHLTGLVPDRSTTRVIEACAAAAGEGA
jgi:D-beta-D-heptose 7-phosphate kinase/D-beta-D-heptose 1-phosphate adenosyltransferase